MTYIPTTWVDVPPGSDPGAAPQLDADNLNHIEQGLVAEQAARIAADAALQATVAALGATAWSANTAYPAEKIVSNGAGLYEAPPGGAPARSVFTSSDWTHLADIALPVGTGPGTVAAGNDARFAGSTAGTAGAALAATDPTTTNARIPTGTAGGGLAGSFPNPSVTPAAGLDTTALHSGTVSGDASGTIPGPIAVTKTGGVPFGSAATQPSSAFDTAGAAGAVQAASLQKTANLSDVASAATALANIGGASLASPALTGTPTAPTATAGTSTTQLATTAFAAAAAATDTSDNPQALGTVAPGSTGKRSDIGHIHPMPSLDQINAALANFSAGGYKLTNLATGSASTDAANVGQLPVLAAADASVVVAGTATAPTIKTGTLDVIATQHPPASNWSNNSNKITSVASGVANTDAANVGQLPQGMGAGSISGAYVGAIGYLIGANVSMANGTCYYVPFYCPTTRTFTQFLANVAAAGSTGSVLRGGVYADNGSFAPGALLGGADFGTQTSTAIAVATWTISAALAANTLYWLALCGQGSPTTAPSVSSVYPIGSQWQANFNEGNARFSSGVTGAFATTAPASFANVNGAHVLLHT